MQLFEELLKDTSFLLANSASSMLMHSREKVATPLPVINCILGGGIPLGIIAEASGPPGSGKSTFFYQLAGLFQKSYPEDGIVIILDQETSLDISRLEMLGVDLSRVLRLPAMSMEHAFLNLFKILEKVILQQSNSGKKVHLFVVYDTISTGGTEKQHQAAIDGKSVMNAGGMVETARILKQNINNLFPYLEKIPMFIGLLNQVFTQIGGYTSTVSSGGGFGLKHGAHIHFNFSKGREIGTDGFLLENKGIINLDKSKLSPRMLEIPCNIDITEGGIIDPISSFYDYISKSSISIIEAGAWNSIAKTLNQMEDVYTVHVPEEYKKSFRKTDLIDLLRKDDDLVKLLQIRLIDFLVNIYHGQSEITKTFKNSLINECSYINAVSTDLNESEEK